MKAKWIRFAMIAPVFFNPDYRNVDVLPTRVRSDKLQGIQAKANNMHIADWTMFLFNRFRVKSKSFYD